jgi:hypothetical protein
MPSLEEQAPTLEIIEAASSHGPVDSKRHAELATLFSGSTAEVPR